MATGRKRSKLLALTSILFLITGCAPFTATYELPPSSPTATPIDFANLSYLRGVNVFSLYASRFQSTDDEDIGEPQSSYDYLAARGTAVIRLAVPWERVQPIVGDSSGFLTQEQLQTSIDAPVDQTYLSKVADEVAKIQKSGMRAILDLHSACRYPSSQRNIPTNPYLSCGEGDTSQRLVAVWGAISAKFKSNSGVIAYDIINEADPNSLPGGIQTYVSVSQKIVDTIRAHHDSHVIWAQSGVKAPYLSADMSAGPWLTDPLSSITYSQHFYPEYTGTQNRQYTAGVDQSVSDQLTAFAEWCEKWSVHCSVGEIGWPSSESQPQWPGSGDAWNALGNKLYDIADKAKMDVTYFAAQSSYDEHLIAYDNTENPTTDIRIWPLPGINQSRSQAQVIEAHPSK